MRKSTCYAVVVGLCLAASPVLAAIHASLETPGEEQTTVSGISQVRGWAYSDTGATVTVTLRVNEANQTDTTLPCCSARADVKGEDPQIPLNTGFNGQINYGLFDPATLNSIGVQITAQGEDPVTIDRSVTAVKPGNAEFLNTFSLGAGANATVDGDEIVVGGAQVTFDGGSTKTNLRLKYETSLQSPTIIEAFDGTNADLFNQVQAIFTNSCALVGCHGGPVPVLGQDLSAGNSWKSIVAVRSAEDSSRPRVSPGDDERSYLYQKIIPGGDIAAGTSRMPLGCSGASCLSQSDIDKIEAWINDGARPPQ